MVWKKGKKPEQYLFTITEEFTNDWNTFKNKASENKQLRLQDKPHHFQL